jgi:hypothetical protein
VELHLCSLIFDCLNNKRRIIFQFNSIQYLNGNSTVYWRDPINIKSTSQRYIKNEILKHGSKPEGKDKQYQWRIQGGALGASPPPRRISQAHILTYAFQG